MINKSVRTVSYLSGSWNEDYANIIGEQPVTLTINSEPWLTFMCTPNELEELAIGFLYNEEVIRSIDDIVSIRVCPQEDNIDVWLNRSISKPKNWTRTTGCSGGKTSVGSPTSQISVRETRSNGKLPAEKIRHLINQLNKAQDLYRTSGGVHTSALSDGNKIIISSEDIGRHNTLDKLAGRCILEKINPERKIILTTGRISSEMIQKAGRIGAIVVISRTSPSTLSVQDAQMLGITLIGYARGDRFTIYTYPERILFTTTGIAKVRHNDQ